jgi:hypothetical protein
MNPWSRAVDQGENTALHTNTRGGLTSVASRLRPTSAATDCVVSLTADDVRTNGYVEISVSTLTTGSDYVGVTLRTLSATQYYAAWLDGSGFLEIARYNSGYTNLIALTNPLPALPFTFGGDIVDDKIRLWLNGQVMIVASDTTFTGPGRFGIYAYATTTVANIEIDRWEAGPVNSPALVRSQL